MATVPAIAKTNPIVARLSQTIFKPAFTALGIALAALAAT